MALLALSGVVHLVDVLGVPEKRGWPSIALVGALAGIIMYVTLRILFYRLAELSAHWALRTPRFKDQSLALQLRSTCWEMAGFALCFAVFSLIADSWDSTSQIGLLLSLPIFASTIPLYETLPPLASFYRSTAANRP
jgi:hypothetical protein